MSANNEVQISNWGTKTNPKWMVFEVDVDSAGGHCIYATPFATLEKAVEMAQKYMQECSDQGWPVEYGLNIVLKARKRARKKA